MTGKGIPGMSQVSAVLRKINKDVGVLTLSVISEGVVCLFGHIG